MIRAVTGGVEIMVRVSPRATRAGLGVERNGVLLVRLHAAPVEGAANQELMALLAKAAGVAKRDVTLASGEHSRQKRVRIAGLDVATATARLLGR